MTSDSPILQPVPGPGLQPGAVTTGNPGVLSARNYAYLQKYIYAESGIVIEADKRYLLESRLLPIVKEHQLGSLDALSTQLATRSSLALGRLVIEAITTNETLFFRDPAMFDALRKHGLPAMFDRIRGTRKLRIWSAAASSGQEAYSIAMIMLEMGRDKEEFEILGTDISSQVLERARLGKYPQFEVNRGLPGPYLTRYFSRSGPEWQLKDEVRSLVRFEQLDLRQDLRFLSNFDLVLCRNVLIYFDTTTKRQIVEGIRSRLSPGAVLVLGCSETMINVHGGFHRKTIGQSTFYSIKT